MNLRLGTGMLLMAFAAAYTLRNSFRGGKPYEFGLAMAIGELGLMFLINALFDNSPGLPVVTTLLGLSMLVTLFVSLRLMRRESTTDTGS